MFSSQFKLVPDVMSELVLKAVRRIESLRHLTQKHDYLATSLFCLSIRDAVYLAIVLDLATRMIVGS